tara:strand:- start:112 stop:267 length:156 start_codon:yes stop_codon:yes gene_type:complete
LGVRRKKLEKYEKSAFFMIFECFFDQVLASIFGLFLVAWHAPGGAANNEKS